MDSFAVTSAGGRQAQITVAADGAVTFDPQGNFGAAAALGDTVQFDYTVSDGHGGTDVATASFVIGFPLVQGANGDDFLALQGLMLPYTIAATNPYSGETVLSCTGPRT